MPVEIPDVNVLLALAVEEDARWKRAQRWLEETEAFATTPVTEAGAVRLLCNPRVSGRIMLPAAATIWLAALRTDTKAQFIADDASITDTPLDTVHLTGYRQVTDFHLVDLARKHNAVLVTFDAGIRAAFAGIAGDAIRVL